MSYGRCEMNKVAAAIDRIKLAREALQLRAPAGEKLYVAYSGGKDSECIAELANMMLEWAKCGDGT